MTVLCTGWVMLFSKTDRFDLVSGRSSTNTNEAKPDDAHTITKEDDGTLTDPDYSRWQTEIVRGKYSMSVSSGDRVIAAGTNFCL